MIKLRDASKRYPLAAYNGGGRTVVDVGGVPVGDGSFTVIAGPCAAEAGESLYKTAAAVRDAGASIFRAGKYKQRTSPYSFSGLGKDGLELLMKIKEMYGIPVVTELTSESRLKYYSGVDLIQIGARNMQNFDLLRAVGRQKKPVLLKRGFGCTVDELLLAAEYILSGGNDAVILCERGIRTFESSSGATLDIAAVPYLKRVTHLPVIVDPSHAAGSADLVAPLALAAAAAGADGVMIECHYNPSKALLDARQTITPDELREIVSKCAQIRKIIS